MTVVLAAVSATTDLGQQLDPEALRGLMGRVFVELRQIVERHGGTIDKSLGDDLVAIFGIPIAHEDDALRAVRAAAEVGSKVVTLNEELRARRAVSIAYRIGVATGEVLAGDPGVDHSLITGDTVNTAARLQRAAQPGESVFDPETYWLVRDAVIVEPVESTAANEEATAQAYRLVSIAADVAGRTRRLDTPLVGRERELARLDQAYGQAVADRSCQLFTLLGAAGVGKSRLVAEFTASVADQAQVLKGRCLPYGEGITYWPIREIVHQASHIDEGDSPEDARAKLDELLAAERESDRLAARIASAVGLSLEDAPQEEIFWATRTLLEHLARERPLVVLVEDIHWAEPALFDLLEHVADLARDVPLLILCPARPELLDKRPGWGGGKVNATTVLLDALGSEATAKLIDALPGGRALPKSLRERILTAAEGNPLYVEEMLGMLLDEGLLAEDGASWRATADLERVKVPPTVKALLAARLDGLAPAERSIAEHAAVIGRVFEQAAIAALAPESLRPEVTRGLLALVRKELVRPERSDIVSGDAFKFRHQLIRDAAYETLPKAERAELHERFAGWLANAAGERALEYEEIIGYHLEQAHRYQTELGGDGERVAQLGQRAGELLARSGERAIRRGDVAAAMDFLTRGVGLLSPGRERARAATSLAVAESLVGESRSAMSRLDEVIEVTRSLGDEQQEWHARVERARAGSWAGEHTDQRIVDTAMEFFERTGDTEGLADAWALRVRLAGLTGDPGQTTALTKAMDYARLAGNKNLEARSLIMLSGNLTFGPAPASEAVVEVERALTLAGSNLRAAARVRSNLSLLVAMRGDFDQARKLSTEAKQSLEELGLTFDAAVVSMGIVWMEMLAARYDVAEASAREIYATLDRLGDTAYLSSNAGLLAEALVLRGQDDEAERYALVASEISADDDYDAQVRWRRAHARVLAHRSDHEGAEAVARDAVEISTRTDDLNVQGDSHAVLGEVLAASDKPFDGRASFERALASYAQKENVVAWERIRRVLAGEPAIVEG
ncbi:MAG: AAA family ATPase [Chloroflexota bacterium]